MSAGTPFSQRRAGRYGLSNIIRSEWTKFWSLRSSWLTLAAFAVLTIALAIVVSRVSGSNWIRARAESRANWDPTNVSLVGVIVGTLLLPLLGVLVIGGEYSSGSIRSTLTAVPRRQMVLASKAIIFGAVAFIVAEASTFAAFFAGQMAMGAAPHASLGQPGVLRAVMLSGGFLALMGLFGLWLGTIFRSSIWAIAIYVIVAFVSPIILFPLPNNLWRYVPTNILGNSVSAVNVVTGFPAPWIGFGMMGLYVLAVLTIGGILFVRRDA